MQKLQQKYRDQTSSHVIYDYRAFRTRFPEPRIIYEDNYMTTVWLMSATARLTLNTSAILWEMTYLKKRTTLAHLK